MFLLICLHQPQRSWNRIPNHVSPNCVEQFFWGLCISCFFVRNIDCSPTNKRKGTTTLPPNALSFLSSQIAKRNRLNWAGPGASEMCLGNTFDVWWWFWIQNLNGTAVVHDDGDNDGLRGLWDVRCVHGVSIKQPSGSVVVWKPLWEYQVKGFLYYRVFEFHHFSDFKTVSF